MNLHTIKGKMGKTVIYSIPDFLYAGNTLSWSAFRFYTPQGDKEDDKGKYFDVPSISEEITGDPELDLIVSVKVSVSGIEIVESLSDNPSDMTVGIEGDIVATLVLPASGTPEVSYKEVLNES